ncbi:MAG: hypothetical protein HDR98_00950 [Bacteroides sp.]|nr:hypothetical protein [Bacteroides sp.]
MPESNGHITAPVGLATVAKVLGENKLDTATLCTSPKINRWAKYKPVRVDTPADITETQRKAVNHGLAVTNALLADGYTYNLAEWGYNKPDGIWWKRLTDFIGYRATAKPPIYIISDEPEEDGCTVITWDEGTTKIDDFKVVAGYTCGSKIVGPPMQAGISMDELNFGATSNIGARTFGLLRVMGSTKVYLGATKIFDYDANTAPQGAPVIDFSVKSSLTSSGYNYISDQLMKLPVGSYIEVLPVIDTMDFVANKIAVPGSGLTGFPVGKKLRIYHQKTPDWYMTGLVGNIGMGYITNKDTGTSEACGTMAQSSSNPGTVARRLPSDPGNQYYEISAQYNFYNTRNDAVTLYAGAFYLVIGSAISVPAISMAIASQVSGGFRSSVSIPKSATTSVIIRFRLTVEEFNTRFAPVPNLSTQPTQSAQFILAFRNPHNLVTVKNTSGVEQTNVNWLFYFKVTQ